MFKSFAIGEKISSYGYWVATNQFTAEGATFGIQAEAALEALKKAAAEKGMLPSGYVKANVMLRDPALCGVFLEIYRHVIGEDFPAVSFVPENFIADDALFGIEVFGVTADAPGLVRYFGESDFEGVPSVVKVGDYGFSSAILPSVDGDFAAQCRSSMDRLIKAMAALGFSKSHFGKNLVLLDDCGNFDAYNVIYSEYYDVNDAPPARSLYGVSAVPGGKCVSTETVAYLGGKKPVNAVQGAKIALPFVHATLMGDLLFISGQIGLKGANGFNPAFGPQTEQMFSNVKVIAEAAGCKAEDYLKFNAFVTDRNNGEEFIELFNKHFGAGTGAAPLYEVNGLAHTFLTVEMDAVAFTR